MTCTRRYTIAILIRHGMELQFEGAINQLLEPRTRLLFEHKLDKYATMRTANSTKHPNTHFEHAFSLLCKQCVISL